MADDAFLHCAEIMKRVNNQRQREAFCDVTLVVEGKEFKGHRNILAAASPYFDMMFTSDMKEKQQKSIQLGELTASATEYIIEFIYTGQVQIDYANVNDLLASADYLLLASLKTRALELLLQNLSVSNCLSTFYLAEKYECHDLLRRAREFINRNFSSVSKSDNFLALKLDQVKKWISSDDIIISAEEEVFEVVVKWIGNDNSGKEREGHFLELSENIISSLTS